MHRRNVLVALPMLLMGLTVSTSAPAQSLPSTSGLGLSNIIQKVSAVNGQLIATTTQGQQIPLVLSASPSQVKPKDCPILNLQLGPINLNLLGLQVTTSAICVSATAEPGRGNLLGNLLCDVARLLDRGVSLSQILSNLSPAQLSQLTTGLTNLLNGALNNLNQAQLTSVTPPAQSGACPVLNLTLGPLDLDLLGLRVQLNNCANPAGAVTVNVSAVPGATNVLGNLICGILIGLHPGPTLQQVLQQVLQAIIGALPAA